MKNLKSLFLGSLVAATLMLAPAKKAEAGVIVGFTGMIVCSIDSSSPTGCTGVALGLGGGLAAGGIWLMVKTSNIWLEGTGTLIVILDQENPAADQLEQGFAAAYPFIDNEQVIKNLAVKISNKIPADLADKVNVTLTENETRTALEGADLSEAQIQQVVDNLK